MAQAIEKKMALEGSVAFEVLIEKVPELKEVKELKKLERNEAGFTFLKALRIKIKRPGKRRTVCIYDSKPNVYSRNLGLY